MTPTDLKELELCLEEAEREIALAQTREAHIRATAHAGRIRRIIHNVYGYPDTMSA